MISINVSLSHYKRRDIQDEILANSENREVVAKFNDSFGKRPDIVRHPNDILQIAKQGATSFHASEELWRNPLQLESSLRKYELDKLRIGWDLVLDIDCIFFEYSRIAADLVVNALKFHKINSISCKFSGNNGFHIGVPFEAFPEKIRNDETKGSFPEIPRKIALYIKEMIKIPLGEKIMEFEKNNFDSIIEKTGKRAEEIVYENIYENSKRRSLNAEPFLAIDTLLISSRHLYRMPYSLHEKSGLVSISLNPEEVLSFKKELAIPKNAVVSKFRFLDRNAERDEAKQLLVQAYDFSAKQTEMEEKNFSKENFSKIPENALPEKLFPPCIKIILNGLEDGRKRALFILINYFTSIGWGYDMIEKKLSEWNKKNKEPLREVYILGQLRHHRQVQKKVMPPNCKNEMYMLGIGVCKPDNFCPKIKNPAQYTMRKAWRMNKEGSGE